MAAFQLFLWRTFLFFFYLYSFYSVASIKQFQTISKMSRNHWNESIHSFTSGDFFRKIRVKNFFHCIIDKRKWILFSILSFLFKFQLKIILMILCPWKKILKFHIVKKLFTKIMHSQLLCIIKRFFAPLWKKSQTWWMKNYSISEINEFRPTAPCSSAKKV